MIKNIVLTFLLLVVSSGLFGADASYWTQKDYEEYVAVLDKIIESSTGETKEKYKDLKEIIVNTYRLGREHELDNCRRKKNKRNKQTSEDNKESA